MVVPTSRAGFPGRCDRRRVNHHAPTAVPRMPARIPYFLVMSVLLEHVRATRVPIEATDAGKAPGLDQALKDRHTSRDRNCGECERATACCAVSLVYAAVGLDLRLFAGEKMLRTKLCGTAPCYGRERTGSERN